MVKTKHDKTDGLLGSLQKKNGSYNLHVVDYCSDFML